jgi:hypothetical protein
MNQPIRNELIPAVALRSAPDEVPHPPRFPSSLPLKLRIAELFILTHLGGDDVGFDQLETSAAGESQKIGQIEWIRLILQLPLQFGPLPGIGQKGIQLLQAHHVKGDSVPF